MFFVAGLPVHILGFTVKIFKEIYVEITSLPRKDMLQLVMYLKFTQTPPRFHSGIEK